MPGAAGLIGLFLRYLWPFIKEWFFDKKTAVKWLKKNSVAICFTVCLFTMAYASFKIILYAVDQKHLAMEQVKEKEQLEARLAELTERFEFLTSQNNENSTKRSEYRQQREELRIRVELYEYWMRECGMEYQAPTPPLPRCKNTSPPTRTAATPPRRTPSRPTPTRSTPATEQIPSRNSDISERVRDIWSQTK